MKQAIPDLTETARATLVIELYKFAASNDRIWSYDKPMVGMARLTEAIILGRGIRAYSLSSYLMQELNKYPELQKKVKPYYEFHQ